MNTPNLKTPKDYTNFMRSEAGSNIKPGSEEEKLVLEGFKAARQSQAQERIGTKDTPGPIADELKSVESGGYVRPEGSQMAHDNIQIKVTGPDNSSHPEEIGVKHDATPVAVGASPEAHK